MAASVTLLHVFATSTAFAEATRVGVSGSWQETAESDRRNDPGFHWGGVSLEVTVDPAGEVAVTWTALEGGDCRERQRVLRGKRTLNGLRVAGNGRTCEGRLAPNGHLELQCGTDRFTFARAG